MGASLLVAMSDLLEPDRGSDAGGGFEVSPVFFIAVLGVGFVIGTVGHIIKSRALVAFGVGLVFLATILLPVLYRVSR